MYGAITIGLALAFLPGAEAAPKRVLKVGMASTFADLGSSSSIPHGDFFRRGLGLAIADLKRELNRKGLRIALEEFDYENSRMKVMEVARRAVASDVVAVIGYNYSDHALLAGPIHQHGKLPLISPSATADRVAELGAYVHQVSFNNSFQAKLLAQIARHTMKAKKVVSVVAQDCTYCVDLAADFEKAFESGAGYSTDRIPVLKGDSDFSDLATAYVKKSSGADLIFIPNHEMTSARIIQAFLKAGIKGPFLGGDGWANYDNRIFESLFESQAFPAFAISHWHPLVPYAASRKFLAEYRKQFGGDPNMTSAVAYDSMLFLLRGILACDGYSRSAIEACLRGVKEMDGVTGHFRFRPGQAPDKSLVLLEHRSGRFVYVKTVSPEGASK